MVVRLQTKGGRFILNGSITPDTTLGGLQLLIQEQTECPPNKQKILCGYPPVEIQSYEEDIPVNKLGIRNGDTVILQELSEPRHIVNSDDQDDVIIVENTPSTTFNTYERLERLIVPADNFCLFRSISIIIGESVGWKDMRGLVASAITSQPEKYTNAVLGRPCSEYVEWIMKDESWGGGIELAVFSELFQLELDVVDIQSLRIDKFGQGYPCRGIVLYDGIHYDPLVLKSAFNGAIVKTTFSTNQDGILTEALKIAEEANKVISCIISYMC
jgi:ubiquitin thioesterase OTU1